MLRADDASERCSNVETDLPHLEATLTKPDSSHDSHPLDAILTEDTAAAARAPDVTESDDVSSDVLDWSVVVIALLAAGVVLLLLALVAVVVYVIYARRRSKRKQKLRTRTRNAALASLTHPPTTDPLLQEKNLRNNIYNPSASKDFLQKSVDV